MDESIVRTRQIEAIQSPAWVRSNARFARNPRWSIAWAVAFLMGCNDGGQTGTGVTEANELGSLETTVSPSEPDACDGGCPTGQLCLESRCTAAQCTATLPCPMGQRCEAGVCLDASDGACNVDAECPSGQSCRNGYCSAVESECISDLDCSSGQRCLLRRCIPEAPPCSIDADCFPGERCVQGACLPIIACEEDADCTGDEICLSSECHSPAGPEQSGGFEMPSVDINQDGFASAGEPYPGGNSQSDELGMGGTGGNNSVGSPPQAGRPNEGGTDDPTLPLAGHLSDDDILCDDSCELSRDGTCDDGVDGFAFCRFGTDCTDCGPRRTGDTQQGSQDTNCNDSCRLSNDGSCDDGGAQSTSEFCDLGTDCTDCGARSFSGGGQAFEVCQDRCVFAYDGLCEDGGPGSFSADCLLGTDCFDCGFRYRTVTTPIYENTLCEDTCFTQYGGARNGVCEDGGPNARFSGYCALGTDCQDCGPRQGPFLCEDSCAIENIYNGFCEDGGPGTFGGSGPCSLGADCLDCGPRLPVETNPTDSDEDQSDGINTSVGGSASADSNASAAHCGDTDRNCDETPSTECSFSDVGETCVCGPGYVSGGAGCVDVDECRGVDCGPGGTCRQNEGELVEGQYTCDCANGYSGGGANTPCVDIDECAELNGGCDPLADCTNVDGGRTCRCPSGYQGDGEQCFDIDECLDSNGGCHQHAHCENTPGGRSCTCRAGYAGDGVTCVDIDECERADCGPGGICQETDGEVVPGQYTCVCETGFEGGGLRTPCNDINECAGIDCGPGGSCVERHGEAEQGQYSCTCAQGYSGGGTNMPCVDVDECADADCGQGGHCQDAIGEVVPGQFVCVCDAGFVGGGFNRPCSVAEVCTDADCGPGGVCSEASPLGAPGQYQCICQTGYTGGGINTPCDDIDECLVANGGCPENAVCVNSMGGMECNCRSGFEDSDGVCRDINECQSGNGGCHENALCENTIGARTCECLTGFQGDGIACNDIDECEVNNGGCGEPEHMRCINRVGQGPVCEDIDECAINNGSCGDSEVMRCINIVNAQPVCEHIDSCINGLQDLDESAIDCGGPSDCARCTDGQSCSASSDCSSEFCNQDGRCETPTCPPLLRTNTATPPSVTVIDLAEFPGCRPAASSLTGVNLPDDCANVSSDFTVTYSTDGVRRFPFFFAGDLNYSMTTGPGAACNDETRGVRLELRATADWSQIDASTGLFGLEEVYFEYRNWNSPPSVSAMVIDTMETNPNPASCNEPADMGMSSGFIYACAKRSLNYNECDLEGGDILASWQDFSGDILILFPEPITRKTIWRLHPGHSSRPSESLFVAAYKWELYSENVLTSSACTALE